MLHTAPPLLVAGFPLEWTHDDLHAVFLSFGSIHSCKILPQTSAALLAPSTSHPHSNAQRSMLPASAVGFVTFEKVEDAKQAVAALHDRSLDPARTPDQILTVKFAASLPQQPNSTQVSPGAVDVTPALTIASSSSASSTSSSASLSPSTSTSSSIPANASSSAGPKDLTASVTATPSTSSSATPLSSSISASANSSPVTLGHHSRSSVVIQAVSLSPPRTPTTSTRKGLASPRPPAHVHANSYSHSPPAMASKVGALLSPSSSSPSAASTGFGLDMASQFYLNSQYEGANYDLSAHPQTNSSFFGNNSSGGPHASFPHVYVACFPETWTVQDLLNIASPFGRCFAKILLELPQGKSRGCGFVQFFNIDAAHCFIAAMNDVQLPGGSNRALQVRFANRRVPDERNGNDRQVHVNGQFNAPSLSSPHHHQPHSYLSPRGHPHNQHQHQHNGAPFLHPHTHHAMMQSLSRPHAPHHGTSLSYSQGVPVEGYGHTGAEMLPRGGAAEIHPQPMALPLLYSPAPLPSASPMTSFSAPMHPLSPLGPHLNGLYDALPSPFEMLHQQQQQQQQQIIYAQSHPYAHPMPSQMSMLLNYPLMHPGAMPSSASSPSLVSMASAHPVGVPSSPSSASGPFSPSSSSSMASSPLSPHGSNQDDSPSLFFSNLPVAYSDAELGQLCSQFGAVSHVHIARDTQGESRCYGFVAFVHEHDAVRAMEALNQCMLLGLKLKVSWKKPSGSANSSTSKPRLMRTGSSPRSKSRNVSSPSSERSNSSSTSTSSLSSSASSSSTLSLSSSSRSNEHSLTPSPSDSDSSSTSSGSEQNTPTPHSPLVHAAVEQATVVAN